MINITKNGSQYSVYKNKDANVVFLTQQNYDMLSDEEKYNDTCYAIIDAPEKEALNFVEIKNPYLTYTGLEISPEFTFYNSDKMILSGYFTGINPDTYNITVTLKEGYCWVDGTVVPQTLEWYIGVPIPKLFTDLYTYTGYTITPDYLNYDSTKMTISGDTSGTNVGTYQAIFTLIGDNKWFDGTTDPKVINWSIGKSNNPFNITDLDLDFILPGESRQGNYSGIPESYITVTSSNTSVATAELENNILTVTGVSDGNAIITIEAPLTSNYLAQTIEIPVKVGYTTLTVNIDLTDSNPSTWATYADDAVNITIGDDKFDKFFGYYPVLIQGSTIKRLNPNNFSKYEDGTGASIGAVGNDVMICFPKRAYKISKSDNILTVSITNDLSKSGYTTRPFTYKNTVYNNMYISAYCAILYTSSSPYKLYSWSGGSPTYSNYSLTNFRNYAHNKGTNWELLAWYQNLYIQVLYTIKYKAENSYKIIGGGYGTYSASSGSLDTNGMNYFRPNSTGTNKLFGLENWIKYSSSYYYLERLDGVYMANRSLYISEDDQYATTSSYTNIYQYSYNYTNAYYFRDTIGNNNGGFFMASTASGTGSSTTYFCDVIYPYIVTSSTIPYTMFARNGTDSGYTGIYSSYSSGYSFNDTYGLVRLMYFKN